MNWRNVILCALALVIVTGCSSSRPAPAPVAATPTRERTASNVRSQMAATATAAAEQTVQAASARPTATATVAATTTATPVAAPSATPTVRPTATVTPTSAAALSNPQTGAQTAPLPLGSSSGTLLSLSARKYPAPTLLTPSDNATYHVSRPVVHLSWSPTSNELLTFGQTPGCVSDAINFRRAFESYQLVIHSLDVARPDIVQWNENNPTFDLNLTTVPAGHYSWSVSVVTLCESYVVGQRNDTHPLYGPQHNSDPAYHKSTLERSFVAPASPTSVTRSINWVP